VRRLRRPQRNLVERETVRIDVLPAELRHHHPFDPPELDVISESTLARLRTA
jgi:hypothetical protein